MRTEFERMAETRVLFCLGVAGTSGVGGGMYTVNKKRVKRETKERVLNLLILSWRMGDKVLFCWVVLWVFKYKWTMGHVLFY